MPQSKTGVYECQEPIAGTTCRNLQCLVAADAPECGDCGAVNWTLVWEDPAAVVATDEDKQQYRSRHGEDRLIELVDAQPDAQEATPLPDNETRRIRWIQSPSLGLSVARIMHYTPVLRDGVQVGTACTDVDHLFGEVVG